MTMGLPLEHGDETSPRWGVELIIDLAGCDAVTIGSGDVIRRFVDELIEGIGMEAFGEPLLARFALDNPDAAGFSVAQLITTSLVSGHFSERRRTAYLNVFSCQEFAVDDVLAFAKKFFAAKSSWHVVVPRGAHEPA